MSELNDSSTCDQVLRLIIEHGPISAGELAKMLVLTPAAVRRHVSSLVSDGLIAEHNVPNIGPAKRGRPSRKYVATQAGQAELAEGYADIANATLSFMKSEFGQGAVAKFVDGRVEEIEKRYSAALAGANNPLERVEMLAHGLNKDGYATSLRSGGPRGIAIQLCQGHCPIQDVAAEFPELCEAETRAFARLLDVPIQRLSTLAGGAHVCTTNIPLGNPRKNLGA
ncbi:putative ArsR family transcriptional regulator [Arcanobacterium wilhelmae]|uniref:ArsR family transcriptional regulator n=1 Tax=Arcanobacterium wilhelmae TaxID=1803177 RepID=A0ABT9N8S1_9ACTO|nr:winged helix-turn-helix transcriptional regulator [Arcanobacterium wilhelmae]MDP9799938.1 putative ArsR family transcriptional regulator [Arcanobacterium wilhelmae]WFN91073.1 winged helix-turn-helix transcriptional regulator [Arcanobacterium wilhelmae]